MGIGKRAIAWLIVLSIAVTLSVGVTSVFATDSGIDGSFKFDEHDNNPAILRLHNKSCHNSELLCVKTTTEDFSSIRIVSAAMSWILKSADDYGYMVYTFDKSETLTNFELCKNLEEHLSAVEPNAVFSCKGTVSSFIDGNYGNNVFDYKNEGYTRYKYITLNVNNIPQDKFLVARFYVKKDGETSYATYNSKDKACVYSSKDLLNIVKPQMEIIGHRGAMDAAPQNTFASFEKAAEYGYECVEADFWVTKSGDLLVLHDENLSICGRPDIGIKDVDAMSRYDYPIPGGSMFKPQFIPTVEELIAKVASLDMKLLLHVKDYSTSDEVIDRIINTLKRYDMQDKTTFVTSSKNCFRRIANHNCKLCFLVVDPTESVINEGFDLCSQYWVRDVMVEHENGFPTAANIKTAHERGLRIGVYNASDLDSTFRFMDDYCDFSMINNWM